MVATPNVGQNTPRMENGFAVLHRKMTKWEWYTDPNVCRLFTHLILMANWEDGRWRGIEIKRGQRLTSLSHLSKETGLSIQQVRTALDKLTSTHDITKLSTQRYTIITVTNYDKYQTVTHDTTNNQHTRNTLVTTNNNNNKKNKKERGSQKRSREILKNEEFRSELSEKFPSVDVGLEMDKAYDWLLSKGKRYKDYTGFARNWCRRIHEGEEKGHYTDKLKVF